MHSVRDEGMEGLRALVSRQDGVVTRTQVLACGLTQAALEARLVAGKWQKVFPGVYATFSGPLPRRAAMWAAVLRAGPGTVLSHESAAELVGLLDQPTDRVHLTVPHCRTPARIPGVVIHRSRRASRHPARLPPQTRVEDTVIDLTQTAVRMETAISWLARAVAARLTTPER